MNRVGLMSFDFIISLIIIPSRKVFFYRKLKQSKFFRLHNEKFHYSTILVALASLVTSVSAFLGIIFVSIKFFLDTSTCLYFNYCISNTLQRRPPLVLGLLVNQTVTFLIIQICLCDFILHSIHSKEGLILSGIACVAFIGLTCE
jgi:hypothetical protein